jgi:hypothetical protein
MPKPILVITHERSGTHLLINCINFLNKGGFCTIGYISNNQDFNIKAYKHATYRDIISNACESSLIYKSHHQIQFVENYLNFLFERYKVIYVKRNLPDVLTSYYKFIQRPDQKDFPNIEEWIFSKPDSIGRKYLQPYSPDPHIIIEPENYVHRWYLHTSGWLKHANQMLVVNYEDTLLDYRNQKQKIEDYIGRKIADKIPDINDKSLPNFGPVKGIIGGHKEIMSEELQKKIEDALSLYTIKEKHEKREPSSNHLNWGLL